MLQELSVARLAYIKVIKILQLWYHIDGIMRYIKYDVTEGLCVKSMACH